jgi:type I restriction enzyme R subunit
MALITEAEWEDVALEVLAEHGWRPASGAQIAAERSAMTDLVLPGRLVEAVRKLNPLVPDAYVRQAVAEILTPASQDALAENERMHSFLVHGYRGVVWTDADGVEHNPTLRLLSTDPGANDWLAVRQVTVRDSERTRRFDVVLYCNGLPVSVIELKQAGQSSADLTKAHAQLATYLAEFPMAFRSCVLTVVSDGVSAKYGTPFTPLHHHAPWNVDDDGRPVDVRHPTDETHALQVTLDGLFNPERFIQLLRLFTAFDGGDNPGKRIAKPHQYFAVSRAVAATIEAVRGDGKAGVVWHTQGSGKSMEMELYTNALASRPELQNPTVIVVTDRTELDGQLFSSFERSHLLPSTPVQVRTREDLRAALTESRSGGIFFTTLQKFGRSTDERDAGLDHPTLSERRNIVVVVDEAHRSHYDDLDGYARHLKDALPYATLIAFTGTPISLVDRNTREVFGDYIDVYDLSRAVADGATVPVVVEPRLVKIGFSDTVTADDLDRAADEVAAGLDDVERARIEASVAVINAIYGAPARLQKLAADIVTHWETRRMRMRPQIDGPGKGMIVCATREICARLYEEIIALRPNWHSDALDGGVLKVVYSGSASDVAPVSRHVRRESANKVIKERLRRPDDPLELVIVKDMMLTGYDSQPLHTLYLDRPLKGALLMQTLARVNRTFRDKDAGLLVAYAPLVENLAAALAEYSPSDQHTKPIGRDVSEAIELARTLVGQIRALVAGYDWQTKLAGPKGWLNAALGLTNWVRSAENPGNQVADGTETLAARFRRLTAQLQRAWSLAAGADNLDDLMAEVRLYAEVRVYMAKFDALEREARGEPVPDDVARLLRQLVADAAGAGDVVDIYEAAQIDKPNFDDLTPAMLARAQQSANPHLAIEALRAAVLAEATKASGRNLVRERAFSDRLAAVMNRYTNQQLTAAEVLAELYAMAREIAAEAKRGEQFHPPLGSDELAAYDAIADNDSAVDLLGQDVLAVIARELIAMMRRDATVDWTIRDDVRAKLRANIKRLLRRYKYPPDQCERAVKLVIEQMEVLGR